MTRITGLGGIFYRSPDPERTRAWYEEKLGVGGLFRWSDDPQGDPYSLLSAFSASTDYFAPSDVGFMINFRVDDLDAFIRGLEEKGVEVIGRQDEDYGRFAWILDIDGHKIELWQQIGPAPEGG